MTDFTHESDLLVKCKCGHVYTLHLHTVCPKCFAWPKDGERVYEVKDK